MGCPKMSVLSIKPVEIHKEGNTIGLTWKIGLNILLYNSIILFFTFTLL